jgi:SAM-dependent methyltransferase
LFSLGFLHNIRRDEIEFIAKLMTPRSRVLEIGAGTGEQANELRRRGFNMVAIDVPSSNYAAARTGDVIEYDGKTIPLPDASVDIVFSSNTLEHVPDLPSMHREIARVLRPGGYCLHAMPTHTWRFWTTLLGYPDAVVALFASVPKLVPRGLSSSEGKRVLRAWYDTARYTKSRLWHRRHGERGVALTELWLFHPRWWRQNFQANGFEVVADYHMGLFYSGNMLAGDRLSLRARRALARLFGSSCHLYHVRPSGGPSG